MRLRESLDRMRVHASVAGGAITGELHDADQVELTFTPGYYDRVAEPVLIDHLVALARVMHAEYVRQYLRAVSEASGRTITKEPAGDGRRDRAYAEQRQELIAEGRSADGRITVTVRGMRSWWVRIAPGTLRVLDERQFAARFGEAAHALIRDQFAGIRALKNHVYG
ncbi:hypothetical protein [Actinoplanes teichomyceticus]|uniref:Uncharacterized protein n=1 Tax=Actinoplanes teichomyceticus TaxID=1867 RepID=A0A561VQC0_ACTTI|nr:hypothetical protein [Actinoplanes teichomyceticus]TWG13782.1 hypothetical protein FHX34_10470 [Actinoplanes teichomyceticus]GIF12392.1 hypothetical protein Ate01nite_24240 [Actinoplanes teichomyceticus]